MDVGLFHVLKEHWRNSINEFRMTYSGAKIKREEFCGLLKDVLDILTTKSRVLRSAFRACGLYPFNADLINYALKIKRRNIEPTSTEIISAENDNDTEIQTQQAKDKESDRLFHLEYFEKYIGEEKLKQFRESGNAWNGELKDESLFYMWVQMCSGSEDLSKNYKVVATCTDENEVVFHELMELEDATENIEDISDDDECKKFFSIFLLRIIIVYQ